MTRLKCFARVTLLVAAAGFAGDGLAGEAGRAASPLSVSDAIASFELEPGLGVQLVAAEPLVASPCAVAWDERGRMYVAENRGYPTGGPGGKPVGSVALLEDADGDGLPEKRVEFAGGLSFPNGLLPWRGGLIVTDAPDVLFLKDADGDGRAEVREILLSGFATDKSTQLRANDPTLGPDGWVYLAGGLSGGKVHSPKRPGRVLDLARSDLKFRPDTGEIEPVEGKGQFGLSFDDAGHRFVCNNRVQVQHAPLPARYLARNPGVASPGVLNNCPELVRNVMLGLRNDAGARIYPISANVTTADSHAGTYSAACAVHIARGDALPAEYVGKAWSCDPTGNLVRYDALEPVGGSFHARRVRDKVEALRSRDDWFRPVFLADGPDGALYVCDMYRKTIEHPEYLPEDVRKNTDFESGKNMGRIWRIARADLPKDAFAKARAESLKAVSGAAPQDVVNALRSPNGWTRDTAMRLLTERGTDGARPQLESVAADADSPAAAVICSLNLLANAHGLGDALLLKNLGHADAGVRETAVRLSEPRLAASPALAERVLTLTRDPHVSVRYAAVLAAGEVTRKPAESGSAAKVIDALSAVAATPDAQDKWFRAAICTALPGREGNWAMLAKLAEAAAQKEGSDDGVLDLLYDLGRLCAANVKRDEMPEGMNRLTTTVAGRDVHVRVAALVGFVERGTAAGAGDELRRRISQQADGPLAQTSTEARKVVADTSVPIARRVRAADFVGLVGEPAGDEALLALLSPGQPADLAVAGIRGLLRPGRGAEAASKLLESKRWALYSPTLRGTVLTLLTGRPEFAPAMVAALEAGTVPVATIAEPQREWLRKAEDPAVRGRAEKLLSASGSSEDRKRAFDQAKAALKLTPSSANGRQVFVTHCASCHRLDREGVAVGPDLYSIRSQPKESILLHIVIPEQEVVPNFAAYDCLTTDGRTITGIMSAETPASVTLRQSMGIEETIPREQIKRLKASSFSLMPPGLEQAIGTQGLADLLAYLRGEK